VILVTISEESFTSSKPRRLWLRWLKRLGMVLLPALALVAFRQGWLHPEAIKKFRETLAEMDRAEPGWRLADIEAARQQVPEEENSARVVVAAGKLLPRGWPPREFEDLFSDLAQNQQFDPPSFARLNQELENLRPALEEARKVAAMPRGRHRIQYQPLFWETLLPDQSEVRRIAHLLSCDALRQAQQRDMKAALVSGRASLNAARSLGDEPAALSQFIRSSCVINTCFDLVRLLAQGEPPSDDLASIQHSLHDEDAFPDMLVATRGERASVHASFDAIENGEVPMSKLDAFVNGEGPMSKPEGSQSSVKDYVFGWSARERYREAHPSMLAVMNRYVTIAQLPMPKQAAAEREVYQQLCGLKGSSPLAVLFIPALQKVFDTSRRKHAYLRCTVAALAAERYRQKHQKWPDSLDKLRPPFLADVPLDPFDGEQLRSRRVEDGVVIYSVSSDRTDNNGNLDRAHPDQPGVDIGVRLWDVAKRRQPPRPKPDHERQP
jgi:hypothetical protein